ncbi:MAG: hypothetical protein WBL05_03485 [Brooklawnia sp.]|uniref:hypothetical protein n=1 Tax=Brooklawnia sp. TaxID=2699740 RepID=UPI003C720FEE
MADKVRTRQLGRDGITVMVNHDRALRAREVALPTQADKDRAEALLPAMLDRVNGRRR